MNALSIIASLGALSMGPGISIGEDRLLTGAKDLSDLPEAIRKMVLTGRGSGRCTCGRTISKNKSHCKSCLDNAAAISVAEPGNNGASEYETV